MILLRDAFECNEDAAYSVYVDILIVVFQTVDIITDIFPRISRSVVLERKIIIKLFLHTLGMFLELRKADNPSNCPKFALSMTENSR